MAQFQSRPEVIDAVRWEKTRKSYQEVRAFCGTAIEPGPSFGDLSLRDYSGWKRSVSPGDWIIKREDGEFYRCADVDFQQRYEPVIKVNVGGALDEFRKAFGPR